MSVALVQVLRRLGTLAITLLASSLVVFGSLYLAPGDPISFLVQGRSASPALIAELTAQYGLDRPFIVQYLDWIGNVVTGDLGRSLQFREDVTSLIWSRMPVTLGLVAYTAIIILIVGLTGGIASALRRGRALDRFVQTSFSTLAAIPAFVAGIVLIAVFSVRLGWFPVFGAGTGFIDEIYHLTLPAVALAATFVAMVGRITRSSVLEQLDREHVEVATSRGLTRSTVLRRHVLRNAVTPIMTVSGLLIAGLLVSSSVVERSFGLSGLGSLLVQSVERQDFPVVQAIVLLVVVAFVFINSVIAVVTPLLDPRSAAKDASR